MMHSLKIILLFLVLLLTTAAGADAEKDADAEKEDEDRALGALESEPGLDVEARLGALYMLQDEELKPSNEFRVRGTLPSACALPLRSPDSRAISLKSPWRRTN